MRIKSQIKNWSAATVLAAGSLLVGCASNQVPPTYPALPSVELANGVATGALVQNADSVLMVMDGSSSMAERYNAPIFNGAKKVDAERQVAKLFANTMPAVSINSGLRTFGFGGCHGFSLTKLRLPMAPFSASGLSGAIDSMNCARGGTPMHKALLAAEQDIAGAPGRVAMVVLSDGLPTDADPVAYAQALKAEFGDRLCIHTVWVGNQVVGQELMADLAAASGCGVAVSAAQVADAGGMSGFIADALFTKGIAMQDADGDGVADAQDRCPGTPRGVAVDANGCALDSDGDGVPDYKDQCPNTPKGAAVNAVGCWSLAGVNFALNSDVIPANAYPNLSNVVNILRNNPNMVVELDGHTDSSGSEKYNLALSERRARSVMRHLIRKDIASSRLSAKGYGESNPIASNTTAEGQAMNRRVDLKILNR